MMKMNDLERFSMPKISFITGIKNRSEELKEMIQSVLDQDIADWELVIVDDHSEEPVEEVTKSFSDQRIYYHRQIEGKNGICEARNLAISNSRGEILLTADGDDINRPQRARVTYDLMTEKGYDVFYSNLEYFVAEENRRWTPTFQPFNADLFRMFNFVTNPGTAFTRQIFDKVGGFDPSLDVSEDYDLYLRMLNAGAKFGYTEEILVNYRRSPQSVSSSKFHLMHEHIMKCRIKNGISPFDISDVKKYALPEIASSILTENGRKLWQDDRFTQSAQ